jgi:predicted nucleotidyltransferase
MQKRGDNIYDFENFTKVENFSQPLFSYKIENFHNIDFSLLNFSEGVKSISQEALTNRNILNEMEEEAANKLENLNIKSSEANIEKKRNMEYKNYSVVRKDVNSNITFYQIKNFSNNPPWLSERTLKISTESEMKFHNEILDFCDFIKLTDQERIDREITFNNFKKIIEENLPFWTVKLYGSFSLGLSLPDSDIDIGVFKPKSPSKSKSFDNYLKSNILNLYSQLDMIKKLIKEKIIIDEERDIILVPDLSLLRFTCKEKNIKIDVV